MEEDGRQREEMMAVILAVWLKATAAAVAVRGKSISAHTQRTATMEARERRGGKKKLKEISGVDSEMVDKDAAFPASVFRVTKDTSNSVFRNLKITI